MSKGSDEPKRRHSNDIVHTARSNKSFFSPGCDDSFGSQREVIHHYFKVTQIHRSRKGNEGNHSKQQVQPSSSTTPILTRLVYERLAALAIDSKSSHKVRAVCSCALILKLSMPRSLSFIPRKSITPNVLFFLLVSILILNCI